MRPSFDPPGLCSSYSIPCLTVQTAAVPFMYVNEDSTVDLQAGKGTDLHDLQEHNNVVQTQMQTEPGQVLK